MLTAPPLQSRCRHQDPPALARQKCLSLDLHCKGIYVLKYFLNKMLLLFHPKHDGKLNWCLLYIKGANSRKKCILYFSSEGAAVVDNSRRLLEKEVIAYTTQILTSRNCERLYTVEEFCCSNRNPFSPLFFKDQDKNKPLSTLANLAITITDVQDMDPIFINLPYSTNIYENSPPVRAASLQY